MKQIKCANPSCTNTINNDYTRGLFVANRKVCPGCSNDFDARLKIYEKFMPERYEKYLEKIANEIEHGEKV